MKKIFGFVLLFICPISFIAQDLTQTLKGHIVDAASLEPLPFASIIILNTSPALGTTTNVDGHFTLNHVPVGRYDISISFLGYEPIIQPEVVITSTKSVTLTIGLNQNATTLDEVVINPRIIKERPKNNMASVSARMLSVEEANRYAGGFDDPARLAASFPGVAASSVGNNAIIIRGNSPRSLQWKIEGVEIPNPNHFANLSVFGGGGLTALSSNLLANSDFFTGAFPAEYNNALSGVFDIRMRNGNSDNHEHSFEIGALGIDFASEGPLNKNQNSSYLVNYRYSTLGLLSFLLPEESQGTTYQDLSFKLNFPTEKSGLFSVWGIGLLDKSGLQPVADPSEQIYYQDIEKQDADQYMGAFGVNHRMSLKNAAYINSTLAISANGLDLKTARLNENAQLSPQNSINNTFYNLTLKSFINKKFNEHHTNKTGITINNMHYNLFLRETDGLSSELPVLVSENGSSSLLSAYSGSLLSYNNLKINIGLNSQLFTLNNKHTIEPRFGINYALNTKNSLSFGYGLHSRIEPLNIYFANVPNAHIEQPNKDLDFSKAHHFVLAYDLNISQKTHLKIEPYFQYLFDIPTVKNSTTSLINLQNDWFINEAYSNLGSGQNYGVDLTLEQYINNGFYYLISASVFNSKYKTDLEPWYNTRYNKNFLLNVLVGKEYTLGPQKQKTLGVNIKLSLQGGDRYSIVDEAASELAQDVIYDKTNPFTQQASNAFLAHLTVNYAWHKKKSSQKISLKILNATKFEEFQGHRYNLKTNAVDIHNEALFIPNISYKISF